MLFVCCLYVRNFIYFSFSAMAAAPSHLVLDPRVEVTGAAAAAVVARVGRMGAVGPREAAMAAVGPRAEAMVGAAEARAEATVEAAEGRVEATGAARDHSRRSTGVLPITSPRITARPHRRATDSRASMDREEVNAFLFFCCV